MNISQNLNKESPLPTPQEKTFCRNFKYNDITIILSSDYKICEVVSPLTMEISEGALLNLADKYT